MSTTRATDGPAPAGEPAQGRELRARGRATLRRLLDAGTRTFAERGYHAARVDDVVKLANTSHGTFYLYFSNKEDLFRALVTEVAEEMRTLAARIQPVSSGAAGRAALRSWISDFCDLYERSGPVIRAWTEAETNVSAIGRVGETVLGDVGAALAQHVPDHDGDGYDRSVVALALVAMLERLNYYVLTGQAEMTREAMIETLTDVTHAALVAR